MNRLHRNPQQAIILLGAKRVDVRGVGMIEQRGQLRLAQEALDLNVVAAQQVVQHLDDGFPPERFLSAAIDPAEPALVEGLEEDEISDLSPDKLVVLCHRRGDTNIDELKL